MLLIPTPAQRKPPIPTSAAVPQPPPATLPVSQVGRAPDATKPDYRLERVHARHRKNGFPLVMAIVGGSLGLLLVVATGVFVLSQSASVKDEGIASFDANRPQDGKQDGSGNEESEDEFVAGPGKSNRNSRPLRSPPGPPPIRAEGYFLSNGPEGETYYGVVVAIPAGRLAPSQADFEKMVAEAKAADQKPPPSRQHVRVFRVDRFRLIVPGGSARPATDGYSLSSNGVSTSFQGTMTSFRWKEPFDAKEVVKHNLRWKSPGGPPGSRVQLKFDDDSPVVVPRKKIAPARSSLHIPKIPPINIPPIPPINVPPVTVPPVKFPPVVVPPVQSGR